MEKDKAPMKAALDEDSASTSGSTSPFPSFLSRTPSLLDNAANSQDTFFLDDEFDSAIRFRFKAGDLLYSGDTDRPRGDASLKLPNGPRVDCKWLTEPYDTDDSKLLAEFKFVQNMERSKASLSPEGLQLKPRLAFSANPITLSNRELYDYPPADALVTLSDLIPNRTDFVSALVTTFHPFSRKFLATAFPGGGEITCVRTDSDEAGTYPLWICETPWHDFYREADPNNSTPKVCDLCFRGVTVNAEFFRCEENERFVLCRECHRKLFNNEKMAEASAERAAALRKRTWQMYTQTFSKDCNCTRRRRVTMVIKEQLPDSYSILHSSLMLLQYDKFLRVIVSSFNLSDEQWDTYTDSFWFQDFPIDSKKPQVKTAGSEFLDDLVEFLVALDLQQWAQRLGGLSLDLSNVDPNVYLVTSVVKSLSKSTKNTQRGASRIEEVLQKSGATSIKPWIQQSPVIFQEFSLGSAGEKFLSQLTKSFGCASVTDSAARVVMNSSTFTFDKEEKLRKSNLLWVSPDNEFDLNYHSNIAYRYIGSKAKTPICPSCGKLHGWLYVGSHNFSKASWESQIWELGVVWTSPSTNWNSKIQCGALDLRSLFLPGRLDQIHRFGASDFIKIPDFTTKKLQLRSGIFCVSETAGDDAVIGALYSSMLPLDVIVKARLTADAWRANKAVPKDFPPKNETLVWVEFGNPQEKEPWFPVKRVMAILVPKK